MGAENNKQGFVFLPSGQLDNFNEALVEVMFDEQTDQDEQEIQYEINETKLYKKMCLVKTFLFPYEIVLTRLFMGKVWYKEKIQSQKLYWKFLTKKIKIKTLKDELYKMIQRSKEIA